MMIDEWGIRFGIRKQIYFWDVSGLPDNLAGFNMAADILINGAETMNKNRASNHKNRHQSRNL